LLRDAQFREAAFDVQWLDRRLGEGLIPEEPLAVEEVALAAAGLAAEEAARASGRANGAGSGREATAWQQTARRESLRG
jgi:hypothetical protein